MTFKTIKIKLPIITGLALIAGFAAAIPAGAQSTADALPAADDEAARTIVIDPVFEYPIAPEEITDLAGKSNYLMEHFWDAMDFKNKTTVDQIALNDAFRVYATPMQWASKEVVDKSVDKLISQYSKNKALTLQFTKAAEEALYGERAKLWIDEIYLKFLDAIMANKKIPAERKVRYERQQRVLRNSLLGATAPAFDFETPQGASAQFRPGLLTVIEFGDPDCSDCTGAKLKMQMNVQFTNLVEQGIINVLFIADADNDGWQTLMADYPKHWHVGAARDIDDIYDLRGGNPYFYVIGADGKILAKNTSVQNAMNIAIAEAKKLKP